MSALEYLEQPPRGIAGAVADGTTRLYLRPLELEGSRHGGTIPLEGGPLRFGACEAWFREPGRIRVARLPVAGLREWAVAEGAAVEIRIARLLDNLCAPRPPFAGLALDRPRLMGVINATPDSFSEAGAQRAPEAAIAHGRALLAAGADMLDVGGESTRPGAEPVAEAEELERVLPVIRALGREPAPVSVDTRRAAVMRAAIEAGAVVVNDVSALTADPDSLAAVADADVPVVLMHMRGEPATMARAARYDNVLLDVYDHLEARVAACRAAGMGLGRIAIDPGFGFAKTAADNAAVLRGLAIFHGIGCALVVGVSRKGLVRAVRRAAPPAHRLAASIAAAVAALDRGARILRVHDVAESAQAVAVWRAIHDPG